MKLSISEKKVSYLSYRSQTFFSIWAVYRYKKLKIENEKFLALQGVAIKSSYFYTEIALKCWGESLVSMTLQ